LAFETRGNLDRDSARHRLAHPGRQDQRRVEIGREIEPGRVVRLIARHRRVRPESQNLDDRMGHVTRIRSAPHFGKKSLTAQSNRYWRRRRGWRNLSTATHTRPGDAVAEVIR